MQPFTNETIDIEQLPKYETTQLTHPHQSYWKVIVINIYIVLFFIAATITTLFILVGEWGAELYVVIGGYLLFGLFLFLIYRASFKKRGFALREKDIIYKSGIIAETTTIVPLNRIQHVALDEGLFSRIFKLGKLQVYTAGGGSGHLAISGIEIDIAKNMKEVLLKKLTGTNQTTEEQ